jgi:RNA polymerase sigma-70 factor, ECF subfamily
MDVGDERVVTGLLEATDESGLVRRARDGDMRAFDRLVLAHSEQVFRLALRMLGSRDEAEDIQQETFVCAYRSIRKFRGESSFATWLYSITSRQCLSRIRRKLRRPGTDPVESLIEMPSPDGDPEDRILAAESARQVQLCLAALAPADRLLLVLKFVEQLSHEEIAEVLQCSEQSSRSRLFRAKRLFKEQYERMG